MKRIALLMLVPLALGRPLAGQSDRCLFQLDSVGGTGVQVSTPAGINYFANGGVKMSCRGTRVSMRSDSVAAYGGRMVEYVGRVHYQDSMVTMSADRGTYYKDGERWEARGNVVTENLQNGSTLRGPSLDYYRAIPGVRDTTELFSVGRPTIRYASSDPAAKSQEPYVIVADRVRMRGNDRVWGGGKVTIDRSDFAARGDSLRLDTGAGSDGSLMGGPVMRGLGSDPFTLTGQRIDFLLDHRELRVVTAKGNGHAVTRAVDLAADTIGLEVKASKLVQTLAWGDSTRPHAQTQEYTILADSLAIDTPGQALTETRAFGRAWVGGVPDSATQERDWLSGDTVVAHFAQRDSAGQTRTQLQTVEARKDAKSFYRLGNPNRPGRPSLNYSRGQRIVVLMKDEPGPAAVSRVEIHGQVDGIQLDPQPIPPDSLHADSSAARSRT
jgi:hypothetical protein